MKKRSNPNVLQFPTSDSKKVNPPSSPPPDEKAKDPSEEQFYTLPLYGIRVPLFITEKSGYGDFSKAMLEMLFHLNSFPEEYKVSRESLQVMVTLAQIMVLPRIFQLESAIDGLFESFQSTVDQMETLCAYMFETGTRAGIFSVEGFEEYLDKVFNEDDPNPEEDNEP